MASAKIKWSEVLEAAGEPAGSVAQSVKTEEARLQSEVAAFEKAAKRTHDPEKGGLSQSQVEAIVKRGLSGRAFDFCGRMFAAELWDAL